MPKTSNGWSMVGMCSQWAIDNGLSGNDLVIYLTIVRNSFGYRKRHCYLKYSDFAITNRNSINKSITNMTSLGYISFKNTHNPKTGKRGSNEYRIIEPSEYVKNFVFGTKVKPKIEEENWYDE